MYTLGPDGKLQAIDEDSVLGTFAKNADAGRSSEGLADLLDSMLGGGGANSKDSAEGLFDKLKGKKSAKSSTSKGSKSKKDKDLKDKDSTKSKGSDSKKKKKTKSSIKEDSESGKKDPSKSDSGGSEPEPESAPKKPESHSGEHDSDSSNTHSLLKKSTTTSPETVWPIEWKLRWSDPLDLSDLNELNMGMSESEELDNLDMDNLDMDSEVNDVINSESSEQKSIRLSSDNLNDEKLKALDTIEINLDFGELSADSEDSDDDDDSLLDDDLEEDEDSESDSGISSDSSSSDSDSDSKAKLNSKINFGANGELLASDSDSSKGANGTDSAAASNITTVNNSSTEL